MRTAIFSQSIKNYETQKAYCVFYCVSFTSVRVGFFGIHETPSFFETPEFSDEISILDYLLVEKILRGR